MKEIRMEVATELEAIEFCNENGYEFIKCYYGRGDNTGKLMMLALDKNNNCITYRRDEHKYNDDVEDTIIFANTSTGRMYVADMKKCSYPTTFQFAQAKYFKYNAAYKKATFMCKNGSYSWRALRVNKK